MPPPVRVLTRARGHFQQAKSTQTRSNFKFPLCQKGLPDAAFALEFQYFAELYHVIDTTALCVCIMSQLHHRLGCLYHRLGRLYHVTDTTVSASIMPQTPPLGQPVVASQAVVGNSGANFAALATVGGESRPRADSFPLGLPQSIR